MSYSRYPRSLFEKRASLRGHRIIVGVDESGRGPLAGPVVAAAVILDTYEAPRAKVRGFPERNTERPRSIRSLKAAVLWPRMYKFKNRIDDCKKLTPKNRLLAYSEISSNSIYSVAIISQNVIDHINIYNATKLAMEKAIIGLGVRPDYLLIDGDIKLAVPCKGESIRQGDSRCLSIACASIVAKVRRDKIMEKLHAIYPKYGFINHKGYGTEEHLKALKKYGPSPLHRLSFEPVKKLI